MRVYPFDVRAALIKSGKREFLSCGFERASLRDICKYAGVTTGAFYSYFKKKEDLFSVIVEPTLKEFCENCRLILERQKQEQDTAGDSELNIVEFILAHRDEFILLFDCADGTRYEGFRDEMMNGFMLQSYQQNTNFHVGRPADPKLVRILLRMKFEGYRQLLYGSYSAEEVRRLVRNLTAFTEAGFIQLMKNLQMAEE